MRERKSQKRPFLRHVSRGAVLVTVLWFITALAIFGMGLGRVSWSVYRFARWQMAKLVGQYSVNAILLMSKFDRTEDWTPEYDYLGELANEEIYESGNVKVVYFLIDEERKININKAPSAILQELPGMNKDKAIAVVNSELRPFAFIEAIVGVEEIEKKDYEEFKSVVTTYGNGAVNINTATEEVLELIGMDSALISQIVEYRLGEDAELYTEDDGFFDSTETIVDYLNEVGSVSLSEEQDINALVNKKMLGVSASSYEIQANVYVFDKLVDTYSVIIGKKENTENYIVLNWRK
ncbi:MAG: helix-hairpin-helix domain-containing protein [Candidatus Omnitrophica bacterium]|nr:helix-hairpin-helix domain-containing protein [Candidatus Omnitrophota bacterium]